MRILLCHNYYQLAGGEDRCFEDEGRLLEQHGHQVIRYQRDNDHIAGLKQQLTTAANAIWNRQTVRDIRQLIRANEIELVHCTNLFPVISPALYYAASRERVPVVQSLHNYRLFCANSYFLREGKVCEDCAAKRFAWPAIQHRCYRDSRVGSAVVATMQAVHHGIGSWQKKVSLFIALTEFARNKFIQYGLPADRIALKPNFVDPIPDCGAGEGGFALFVGRLSPEKGIDLLLRAWQDPRCTRPLHIVGDGPLRDQVLAAAQGNERIVYCGSLPPDQVLGKMSQAGFLVIPSIWYEGLPRTIVESLAVGTPILAADIGSLTDLARPGAGGMKFKAGDLDALRDAAAFLCQSASMLEQMRHEARQEFLSRYTAAANYQTLLAIYQRALDGP
jgi:glycosyltransferase involved in cell wall biosynthesis